MSHSRVLCTDVSASTLVLNRENTSTCSTDVYVRHLTEGLPFCSGEYKNPLNYISPYQQNNIFVHYYMGG